MEVDMKRYGWLVLLLLWVGMVTACGGLGQESLLIPEETEVELGAEYHLQILQEMPELQGDPAIGAYVNTMGQHIASVTDRADLTWHFTVLDTEQINAFAIPGGYLYVTVGLLRAAATGAEIAGVVAHEIAHVTARHGVQSMETYVFAEGIADLLGDDDLGPLVSGAIQTGAGLTFSQDQELEADSLGVGYALDAGYNPWGIVHFFETLQDLEGTPGEGEGEVISILNDLGELFSTHPPTDERIANVKALIGAEGILESDNTLAWETDTELATLQLLLPDPVERIAEEEIPAE
jgi:predicted Zn-dependent protease